VIESLSHSYLIVASYYLLLAAGLGLCLYLFVTLKREIWKLEARWRRQQSALEDAIQQMRADVEDLKTRLQEAEERAGLLVAPTPPRSGLNLSKRTQALRMFHRGESPEQIAAALSIPENEVQLLLKVNRILVEHAQPAPEPQVSAATEPIA
jgi:phage-related baseplate assembly protein